jgi:hypothetical protein
VRGFELHDWPGAAPRRRKHDLKLIKAENGVGIFTN